MRAQLQKHCILYCPPDMEWKGCSVTTLESHFLQLWPSDCTAEPTSVKGQWIACHCSSYHLAIFPPMLEEVILWLWMKWICTPSSTMVRNSSPWLLWNLSSSIKSCWIKFCAAVMRVSASLSPFLTAITSSLLRLLISFDLFLFYPFFHGSIQEERRARNGKRGLCMSDYPNLYDYISSFIYSQRISTYLCHWPVNCKAEEKGSWVCASSGIHAFIFCSYLTFSMWCHVIYRKFSIN